ncbi:hypothetical protein CKO50_22025 [Pseudoalteromonas sp. HM-SA03]|uniref:RES family NAD+ phosphorylase n=1 Tax=Pseudoalteromonas sp. HM-SA03 TaxID=2029678 RepID=UPI000BAE30D4|nr:RES family NAD+ phosphorylase [Pseudoalteromonas sp. HM-SA03]PAX99219.1 hypothetical protein CKO50_22025 [Pseudoalteromonas sp. HM-SA03]
MGIESQGYRLVCTKYPSIHLFDDVASAEDFEHLYTLQELTNPRLQDEVGNVELIDPNEIPYQCANGRSYAVAPFTHVNPNGGRFNDGLFGALYIADLERTAMLEVKYHQQRYYQNVEGLEFDRIVFRSLVVRHNAEPIHTVKEGETDILDPDKYTASQALACQLKKDGYQGVLYPSVRNQGAECIALFTPKPVLDVMQTSLIEMIWDGESIADVNHVTHIES